MNTYLLTFFFTTVIHLLRYSITKYQNDFNASWQSMHMHRSNIWVLVIQLLSIWTPSCSPPILYFKWYWIEVLNIKMINVHIYSSVSFSYMYIDRYLYIVSVYLEITCLFRNNLKYCCLYYYNCWVVVDDYTMCICPS